MQAFFLPDLKKKLAKLVLRYLISVAHENFGSRLGKPKIKRPSNKKTSKLGKTF